MRAAVVIYDPSPVFRRGAHAVLTETGLATVNAPDEQYLARLPNADGVVCVWGARPESPDFSDLARWASLRPSWAFLVVAPPSSSVDVMAALAAGASGIIDRDVEETSLAEAVRTVRAGNPVLLADPRGGLWRAMATNARARGPQLTRRENQVLQALARGLTNRAIADELFISENTVKNHVRRLFEKLGVGSRTEAVIRGAREGIVAVGDHEQPLGGAP